ncbi:MAG TPA: DUF533 domain-containing protein, partial [Vicinamibacterales bacterium]|nr:DUF533 domain-containing protein [Vicinamibacterales bacterium]
PGRSCRTRLQTVVDPPSDARGGQQAAGGYQASVTPQEAGRLVSSFAAGAAGASGATAGWAGATVTPPPLPGAATPPTAVSTVGSLPALPPEVLRIVRLTVSAARADGDLSAPERALILEHARRAGVEADAEQELAHPHPLADIVRGVADEASRHDLYVLAVAIVRADETITGGERIYLAQLAYQLGIDAATAARLETSTAAGIDAAQP